MSTIPLPDRVCDIRWVRGAVLTTIAYKIYSRADAKANYTSIISVEGLAYGTTESITVLPILSVDTRDVTGYFATKKDGFYAVRPKNSAPPVGSAGSEKPLDVISERILDEGAPKHVKGQQLKLKKMQASAKDIPWLTPKIDG